MQENNTEMEEKGTIYEVSYLLLPSVIVEEVGDVVEQIKSAILSNGGTIISDENPVLIDLAYSMTKVVGAVRNKCDKGYFGWVKFEIQKDGLEVVKKLLDTSDTVLRYILMKTVRENTLLQGKMMLKREEKVRKEEMKDVEISDDVVPLSPQVESVAVDRDLDKSIDDLVIA